MKIRKLMSKAKPNKILNTGLESWEGATELQFYFINGNTYVSPVGETYNSEGWKVRGQVDPVKILNQYKKEMAEE